MFSIFYANDEVPLKLLINRYVQDCKYPAIKFTDINVGKIVINDLSELNNKLLVLDINDPLISAVNRSAASFLLLRLIKICRHLNLEVILPLMISDYEDKDVILSGRVERHATCKFIQMQSPHHETWAFLLQNTVAKRMIIEIPRWTVQYV